MSKHYVLNPGDDFYQRFRVVNRLPAFPKDNNASPGQIRPVITHQEGLTLVWVMKWGLIPFWAKERGVGDKMFNLQAESVLTKQGFRQAFKNQRCLIPASGFYKSKIENGQKTPYFFSLEHRPLFSFAGIYDIWIEPVSGHEVYTYAIITVNSNSITRPFGDQMPLILRQSDEQIWIDNRTPSFKLDSLLRPTSEILTISQP